jgi:hypothetical protein
MYTQHSVFWLVGSTKSIAHSSKSGQAAESTSMHVETVAVGHIHFPLKCDLLSGHPSSSLRMGADKSLAFPIFLFAAQPKECLLYGLKKSEQRSHRCVELRENI